MISRDLNTGSISNGEWFFLLSYSLCPPMPTYWTAIGQLGSRSDNRASGRSTEFGINHCRLSQAYHCQRNLDFPTVILSVGLRGRIKKEKAKEKDLVFWIEPYTAPLVLIGKRLFQYSHGPPAPSRPAYQKSVPTQQSGLPARTKVITKKVITHWLTCQSGALLAHVRSHLKIIINEHSNRFFFWIFACSNFSNKWGCYTQIDIFYSNGLLEIIKWSIFHSMLLNGVAAY